ncbi:MAG: HEPN domain-containing protein [Oscillospiraceae bacterium]|nr:HEPN domain-containing protein [Oscillospiraceae bacterium]
MTQSEIVSYWISKSREELESASIMFSMRKYAYTGFMCHQCIEKALKAYFIFQNDTKQPREHKLVMLAKTTQLLHQFNEKQKTTIEKLDPLYTKSRYEDYKNTIASLLTESYCGTLLQETEELMTWILASMKSQTDMPIL